MNTYQVTDPIPNNPLGNLLKKRVLVSPINQYMRVLSTEQSRMGAYNALYQIWHAGQNVLRSTVGEEELMEASIHKYDILHFMRWETLTYVDVVSLQRNLLNGRQAQTVNQYMVSLKGVLRQARNMNLMSNDDYVRVTSVQRLPVRKKDSGRYVKDEELTQVVEIALERNSDIAVRTAAIIGLGYVCGLRISEIVNLDFDSYDPNSGKLLVKGKGAHERTVFVVNEATKLLDRWIQRRKQKSGPLFTSNTGNRLTKAASYWGLKQVIQQAKVANFTFHDLRRKCITDLVDAGIDVITISKLVGHVDPKTTMSYDRRYHQRTRASLENQSGLILPL